MESLKRIQCHATTVFNHVQSDFIITGQCKTKYSQPGTYIPQREHVQNGMLSNDVINLIILGATV